MNNKISTGLCDSDGKEIFVGDKIIRTKINNEMHGDYVIYEVKQQGATPILTYFISEEGQVLPVGYTACILANEYDHKMFVFATDSLRLRPDSELLVMEEAP